MKKKYIVIIFVFLLINLSIIFTVTPALSHYYKKSNFESMIKRSSVQIEKPVKKLLRITYKEIKLNKQKTSNRKELLYVVPLKAKINSIITINDFSYTDYLVDDIRVIIKFDRTSQIIKIISYNDEVFINDNNSKIQKIKLSEYGEDFMQNDQNYEKILPFINEQKNLKEGFKQITYKSEEPYWNEQEYVSGNFEVERNRNNFNIEYEEFKKIEKGSDIAIMSLFYNVKLEIVQEWIFKSSVNLDQYNCFENDILFTQLVKYSFNDGVAVFLKEGDNTEKCFENNEKGVSEYRMVSQYENYLCDYKDMYNVDIVLRPESMSKCDEYYLQKGRDNLNNLKN